jgi:hypothetical protein
MMNLMRDLPAADVQAVRGGVLQHFSIRTVVCKPTQHTRTHTILAYIQRTVCVHHYCPSYMHAVLFGSSMIYKRQ